MYRKISGFFIIVLTLSLILSACIVEYDPTKNMHPAYGTASGTGTGSAQGFGGTVTVTLTLKDGYIENAVVSGPKESTGYGANAVASAGGMEGIIVGTNSVELDTLSGASTTTRAITAAGKAALSKIPGTAGYYTP